MVMREYVNMKKKENLESITDIKEEGIDYKYVLEHVNHWIDSADSKTGIALSLISITFTIYSGFLLDQHVFTANIDIINKVFLIILTLASFLFFGLAVLFFCLVLKPTFKKPVTKDNPLYYYEVSLYESPNAFVERFIDEKNERLFKKGALESIYANSGIALKKMKKFKAGLIFTMLFFLFSVACIVLALFTNFPAAQEIIQDNSQATQSTAVLFNGLIYKAH